MLRSEANRKQALIKGLCKINEGLPSNVCIPFVNNSWRNYTVLNICENESKLFVTNTRAPYLICLEIYRPEEILVTAQNRYREMLMPQRTGNGVGELPLTNRLVDGSLINHVINPFLARNNPP